MSFCAPTARTSREATLGFADFDGADEIFVVGNYGKVTPVRRIDGRDLQPGPFFHRARKLYWEFAHAFSRSFRATSPSLRAIATKQSRGT